jgi:hypothetical protein
MTRWAASGLTLPARRNWLILIFLSAWLVGWAFGEVMVPTQLFSKSSRTGIDPFMLAWLAMWTLGGAFAVYVWLWNLVGREVIDVDSESLRIKREVVRWGRVRDFALTHVRDLRVAPLTFNPMDFSSGLRFWGVGGGAIAFDHGARTYRFGSALDEAEAKQVLARIAERVPKDVLAWA